MGIQKEVYDFGHSIEAGLKERFEQIDKMAEYNQLKVIHAMQKNKVSAECFNQSSGYGYNDLGRDTLEKVYADVILCRRCVSTPADHLWNTCTVIGTDVKSASGR